MELLIKKSLLIFSAILLAGNLYSQTPRQIENVYAFSRLYGYVKYFHPSDEAATIDWNQFAIYGSARVSESRNTKELQAALKELFLPLAPKLQILLEKEKQVFNAKELIPPDTTGYKIIAWQHSGVGLGGRTPVYQSLRTNRPVITTPAASNDYAPVSKRIDAIALQGKDFVFQMKVKMVEGNGQGQLWARVDKADKTMGFFNNMDDRPVKSREWGLYEIKGTVDKDAAEIYVGVMLVGKGEVAFDDVSFKVKEGDEWKELYNESFSNSVRNAAPEGLNLSSAFRSSHSIVVKKEAEASYASIKSNVLPTTTRMHQRLFERYPQPGEIIEKNIGGGLKIMMPVALYGTPTQTFPAGDSLALKTLRQKLVGVNDISGDSLFTRLGDLAITWNIFQHFYPYFDVVKIDWDAALKDAIKEAYANRNGKEFQTTLQHLTARLKDGHIRVQAYQGQYAPPFLWEWIENKLVITHVADSIVTFRKGDIVKKIDGRSSHDYFSEIYSTISAGTKGWLQYRAVGESLKGGYGSLMKLNILRSDNTTADITVGRTLNPREVYEATPVKDSIKMLPGNIAYLNLDRISMDGINKAFPELQKCKAIICDLRGYPRNNHMFITYLLKEKDTSTHWMQIPKTIYPDRERIAEWQNVGWGLVPAKTHLNAKIIFLIDGSAISYAESFMGFIEHYKLATIIGQPTAGTNGNVNSILLPGGYMLYWTGMRVVKHNGTTHHGVGIQPDIFVEKTIKGVREGRDEFLEKALEVAKKPI